MLATNVTVQEHSQTVTIHLPCSKTDPAADSVDRTWGCLCSNGLCGCPYHCAVLQKQFLQKIWGADKSQRHWLRLPFFPARYGSAVDKIKVVETFEELHRMIGAPAHDEDGRRLLGGHSMRLAGARILASSGMHLYQVELMPKQPHWPRLRRSLNKPKPTNDWPTP